jgi:serum/glucocorticoid-regulated kinase 2
LKSIDVDTSMKLRALSVSHTLDVKRIKARVPSPDALLKNRIKWLLSKLGINLCSLEYVKTLGSGAFGVVKLMKNAKGEQFAVKFFAPRPHLPEELLSKAFMREFEALFYLRHPCLIPLYGFSRQTESALAMKYMENGSLHDVMFGVKGGDRPAFWNPTGIAIIICGIVFGMEFIHLAGFVHRDLKPTNLLIDEVGRCRIGDLGSAKFIMETHRWTGGVVGTIQYAAPELYDNPPYSAKIDVFAFGLILYEVLVGRPVYGGTLAWQQIMRKVLDSVRAEFPAWMSDGVKELIGRCWAEKPEDRPQFTEILSVLQLMRFQILPDVDSRSVEKFLSDTRKEAEQEQADERPKLARA